MSTPDIHMVCDHFCHRSGRGCCPFIVVILVGSTSHLSQVWRAVGLVVVPRGDDGWFSRVVGGPGVVVVVVGAGVAFVGARVVFPVIWLAVGLCGFVGFVSFTGTGGVFMADFGVTFPVASIDRLDEGAESVEVVQFADSCDFVLDDKWCKTKVFMLQ